MSTDLGRETIEHLRKSVASLTAERDSLAGKLAAAEQRAEKDNGDLSRLRLNVAEASGATYCDDLALTSTIRRIKLERDAAIAKAEKAEAERDAAQRLSKRYLDLSDASLAREEKLCEAAKRVEVTSRAYFDKYGAEHEDEDCPEDDTCRCEPLTGFSDALTDLCVLARRCAAESEKARGSR